MIFALPEGFYDWIEIDEEARDRGERFTWKLKEGAPEEIKQVFNEVKDFIESLYPSNRRWNNGSS